MQLTIATIVRRGFLPAFTKLCAEPFTPAEKFRLAQSKRALEAALEDARSVHASLVRQYSADGQGDTVAVGDLAKLAAFTAKARELDAQLVDLPLKEPLVLPAQTNLTANDIAELLDLLREP